MQVKMINYLFLFITNIVIGSICERRTHSFFIKTCTLTLIELRQKSNFLNSVMEKQSLSHLLKRGEQAEQQSLDSIYVDMRL